jgi:hypothetical protein
MNKFFLTAKANWKTTSMGLISGFAVLIVTAPQMFGGEDATIVQVSRALLAAGVIGVGAVAKDGSSSD